ncbi:hypothetical protein ABID22_002355 [Pontibacter aydingkolensis]|uniref:Ava_C0101 and related proteins n=1 Tax=Pontibacter aydingkolensis TaxID=1911536 RepID=A0ABS7CW77_9BACT|nr:DUF5996 family protein [Pontibacter aydingkolensis]MBW7467956.1 hypothetical protein [Pontibacter aydingkolensis]
MATANTTEIKNPDFPPLPLEEWEPTKDTLLLYFQIIGKIRLQLMPRRNHWWNITLYVTSRGMGTGPIPYKFYTFEIDFDFIDHQLTIRTSTGAAESFALQDGLSVSNFYTSVMKALAVLGIQVEILAKPYDLKSKIPFAEDRKHATYNPEQVNRYWRAMVTIDQVLKEFSGRFYGKTCPVHLYWHHMDLTVTRFSGKSIPVPVNGSVVEKDAYSHEVISFGFWPGDDQVRFPAFYSYTYPSPPGIELETLQPKQAQWVDANGSPMAMLNYEELRLMDKPREVLLSFLESAYTAGAQQADWPVEELRTIPLDEL